MKQNREPRHFLHRAGSPGEDGKNSDFLLCPGHWVLLIPLNAAYWPIDHAATFRFLFLLTLRH